MAPKEMTREMAEHLVGVLTGSIRRPHRAGEAVRFLLADLQERCGRGGGDSSWDADSLKSHQQEHERLASELAAIGAKADERAASLQNLIVNDVKALLDEQAKQIQELRAEVAALRGEPAGEPELDAGE